MNSITRTQFDFPKQTAVYNGKVRDVYTIEDKYMVMVATDSISAFDVVLPKRIQFKGQVHPYFGKMKELACKYAARVHNMNMLSWDMLADKDGNIKILEVNAASQSHDWLQFDFGALFGEYTEQVVDWCSEHLDFDRFKHFRTWY